MARETWVQSQVESYQRLKKWYLMPPCLTLSIIRYGSRVKWSNPRKGVAPSHTQWCSKLSKREPSGHPRLWSPTLLLYIYIYTLQTHSLWIGFFLMVQSSFVCIQFNGFGFSYLRIFLDEDWYFNHIEFSDYGLRFYCYICNISVDVYFGLRQANTRYGLTVVSATVNEIKTILSHRLNKSFDSKFFVGTQIRQEAHEEDERDRVVPKNMTNWNWLTLCKQMKSCWPKFYLLSICLEILGWLYIHITELGIKLPTKVDMP